MHAGTRMPFSALFGVSGASRAGARAGPTGRLDGRRRLVELDGGKWGLLAWGLALASPLSLSPTSGCPGHAGEREGWQGEV
jgi:hypothetical protein